MVLISIAEIKDQDDLLPQGAQPGTIASDLEQATGLERVEILGKMEGIDIFDMRPLDSSRTGKGYPAHPRMRSMHCDFGNIL
jgi:cytochrome c oxidase subunit 5b